MLFLLFVGYYMLPPFFNVIRVISGVAPMRQGKVPPKPILTYIFFSLQKYSFFMRFSNIRRLICVFVVIAVKEWRLGNG